MEVESGGDLKHANTDLKHATLCSLCFSYYHLDSVEFITKFLGLRIIQLTNPNHSNIWIKINPEEMNKEEEVKSKRELCPAH